ncbi:MULTISPECIES: hypothetical protein [unclassified Pseudomonas]|uniref:hypothetical protein n=1 Tax=unclassified Pseudomonas TaxID=196821 RepID=UPI000DB79AE4|nr:hypothetical protein [Pseudomonas sp. URMO17WK12:I6]PZW63923.1 hypothetical protein F475_01167 [Pseudomonas sp. URMO17WK12:I6]
MRQRFLIRLMFEWGGGVLWCGNEAAREQFSVGPIEDRLALTDKTRTCLDEMTHWHDTSLNWDYPPDPGPWEMEEYERFDSAANALLTIIQTELGPEYEVIYEKL